MLPVSVWCDEANATFKCMVHRGECFLYVYGVTRQMLPVSVWCTKPNATCKCMVHRGECSALHQGIGHLGWKKYSTCTYKLDTIAKLNNYFQ